MQKNNVIKKKDFESYELIIPFISLPGKRHRQFVYSELEKRHPCFSDEFTFDSLLKRICRKGVAEEVYVMNKFKLAEYENHRSIPGFGFYLENLKVRHRVFVERKWKLAFCGLIFCLIILLSATAVSKLTGKELTDVEEENLLASNELVVEENESDAEVLNSCSKNFLSDVAQAGGKISRCEWNLSRKNGSFFETINASLKGVFPENLKGFSGGDVIYKDGIPLVEFSQVQKLGQYKSDTSTGLGPVEKMPNADFNKKLRSIISENGAALLNEKAPPYHIEFTCKCEKKNELKKLIQECSQHISNDNRIITSIKIQQIEGQKLLIAFSIEEDAYFPADELSFNFNSLSEYLDLFIDKSQQSADQQKSENKKIDSSENQTPNEKIKKIGEIKKSDNTSLLFYKTEEGKIKAVNTSLKEDL